MAIRPSDWDWQFRFLLRSTARELWTSHTRLNPRFVELVSSETDFDLFPAGLDLRLTTLDASGRPGRSCIDEIPGCGIEWEELGTVVWGLQFTDWPRQRARLELGRADQGWGGRRNYVASATVLCPAEDLVFAVAQELAPFDHQRMAELAAAELTGSAG